MAKKLELRARRERAGLSQAELAARAGVTRQLIATAETGRHLPAVDAAMKLARALDASVEELFGEAPSTLVGILGPLPEGTAVVAARVGSTVVAHPMFFTGGGRGWLHADGTVRDGALELFGGATAEGFVLVGCDPAIDLAAPVMGTGSRRLISVAASSGAALEALAAGRCHAVIVHGPAGRVLPSPVPVARWRFARWQVGLALPPGAGVDDVLGGRVASVQREPAAASQQALARAARARGTAVPDPVSLSSGHFDAVRLASAMGAAAVTYEPASEAAGLSFAPLETHEVELWIAVEHLAHPGAAVLGELVSGSRGLRERISSIGGYDLSDMGDALTG